MPLSRLELEQIQANREYLDQYTAIESSGLAENQEDLQGVFNHVFSAIRRIINGNASGVGSWTDEPPISLTDLANSASGTWQSHFENGNGSLAIDGTPDANITFIGDGKWTMGNPGADTVFSASGVQARSFGFREKLIVNSTFSPGDTITVPNNRTYTPDLEGKNLRVYHNGILLLPGSGVTNVDENFGDYREVNSTSIITNAKIKTNAVVQFHING